MIPPGIDFVAWVFGMFKAGVVIVLIDPGMGRSNMIQCLSEAKPEGLAGIPLAQLARTIFRSRLRDCKRNFVLGRWPGCVSHHRFQKLKPDEPITTTDRNSEAAVIFTTGSTGPPKGVLYRHRTFIDQARLIRDYFNIQPGTVDVSGFPLFALFNTAMGATTVFPKMDATRPADIDPRELLRAVEQLRADQSFGSPALWNTVTRYCQQHSIRIPGLKRVLSAGAPVPSSLLGKIRETISPQGEVYTPYGATEALPVACIGAQTVLTETADRSAQGWGTCVGNRFPEIQWRVIRITDEPIARFEECEFLPAGEIGELMVSGPTVTDTYVTRTDANAMHKVLGGTHGDPRASEGDKVWHRMGDVGYLDEQDRFWFCGRKSHRVRAAQGTLFTIPCEAIINEHPKIYRSALVGIRSSNSETPVIIAEPLPEAWSDDPEEQNRLAQELQQLASQHAVTRSIHQILLRQKLPVDIRHNSKIFREQLRPWAEKQLLDTSDSSP